MPKRQRRKPPKPKLRIPKSSASILTTPVQVLPTPNNQFETIAKGAVVAIVRVSWHIVRRTS
jgi:hypothetical protein